MGTNQIVNEMIRMQMKLDDALFTGHNASYDTEKCYRALFDELGELNHELKKDWCWWKRTQAAVSRSRVLEELVDCWHFALSIFYNEYESVLNGFIVINDDAVQVALLNFSFSQLMSYIVNMYQDHMILINMVALTKKLQFTMNEVYEAYLKKNQENYERLKNGY